MTIEDKSLDTTLPHCSPTEDITLYYQLKDVQAEEASSSYDSTLNDKDIESQSCTEINNTDELSETYLHENSNSPVDELPKFPTNLYTRQKHSRFVRVSNVCSISMYKISCDASQLCSPVGLLRVILSVCSFLSLICVVSCHTNQHSGFTRLPSADRLQFHVLICVISLIITLLLLLTQITSLIHVIYRKEFNWPLCETIVKGILCILFIISTSLVLHLLLEYGSKYRWVSLSTRALLLSSVIFGFLSMFCAFMLAIISWLGQDEFKIFQEESKRTGNEYLVT